MPTAPVTTEFEAADLTPYLDVMKRFALEVDAHMCLICEHYFSRRIRVLAVWVAVLADRHGILPGDLLVRYRISVHQRHLDGKTLSTRPRTPNRKIGKTTRMHVTRCCNGCQTDLGDVRKDELDAAVAGQALPDVRLECGCIPESEVRR